MSLPSKSQIVEYWLPWLSKNSIDISEPTCWACHYFWWGRYDVSVRNKSKDEILNNWNKVKPLERCHIIPKQFGGPDTVDNLFLMCKQCHDKAPNTRSERAFLKWVDVQNYVNNFQEEFKKELETFGLVNMEEEINKLLKSDAREGVIANLGTHFNPRIGSKITISSFVAAIAQALEDEKRIRR